MRKWSIAAAALLGLALATGGAPAIAQASEIRQIIVQNSYDEGTDPGTITISIDTDEPVAAIHADFLDEVTGQVSGAADNFVISEPAGTWLRYVTSSPVVMEPGRYDVQLTITDADGTVTQHRGDSITYDVVATVQDVTIDRPTIDWDTRDVTVTGVLRGRWPGTGEVRPIGGAEVGWWVLQGGADEPIITAADGTFRRTFTMSGFDNSISLWYGGRAAHTRSGEMVIKYVTVTKQPLRAHVRVDKRRAVVGDPITVSGNVERRGARGWAPAPKGYFDLLIQNCDGTDCTDGGTITDIADDGTFRVEMTAQRTGHFKVTVYGSDFFVGTISQSKVVTVRPAR